jgi:hypothetical protein
MRKLTRKEACKCIWWVPLVFLAFAWMVSLLIAGFTRDMLIIGGILSVIFILLWFLFVSSVRTTTIRCHCGIIFSSDAKNCPSCNLEVPKEPQE